MTEHFLVLCVNLITPSADLNLKCLVGLGSLKPLKGEYVR